MTAAVTRDVIKQQRNNCGCDYDWVRSCFNVVSGRLLLVGIQNEAVAPSAAVKSPIERMRSFFAQAHESRCSRRHLVTSLSFIATDHT